MEYSRDNKLKTILGFLKTFWRSIVVVITPLLLLPLLIINPTQETRCAFVILLMAVYWITEAVPIYVTALLPIFALPLAGIMSSRELAPVYVKEASIVFASGLIVAAAIEHSNLHRRIALITIQKIGQSPRLLLAGFMATTMFLSMWITNTAATAIMVPVVEGILSVIGEDEPSEAGPSMLKSEPSIEELEASDISSDQYPQNGLAQDSEEHGAYVNNAFHSLQILDSPNNKFIEKTQEIKKAQQIQKDKIKKLKYGFYLSIAYAANIGGTGVVTGTAPNLILTGILEDSFKESSGLTFATWMLLMVPTMIICIAICWSWLMYKYIGFGQNTTKIDEADKKKIERLIESDCKKLGPMTYHEKSVATLFLILVPLWVFRSPTVHFGWANEIRNLYDHELQIGDSVPVMFIIFLFFALPSHKPIRYNKETGKYKFVRSEGLLTWKTLEEKVGWGLVILLGGGFAMARGADVSGLSAIMGSQLRKLSSVSPAVLILVVTTLTAMITEIMSNNATTSMMLPVLRELSMSVCANPIYLMFPATIAASFAFMLPVATPANAIVYSASGMPSTEMVKAGFPMNIICILILNVAINTLAIPIFDVHNMPSWTNSSRDGRIPDCWL